MKKSIKNFVKLPTGVLSLLLFLPLPVQATDCVILLHGLGRGDFSMESMAAALGESYHVVNHQYPSRRETLQSLAAREIPEALSSCPAQQRVHFVTHSMGGILLRQYLSAGTVEGLGRVVMLGPPNNGSEVVDRLDEIPGFEFIGGPAAMQLGSETASHVNTLGAVDFELGVIAGNRSINPLFSSMLPDGDDGAVSVSSTRVDGMRDHIVLPVTHSFMMRNPQAIRQTLHFLEYGSFDHAAVEEQ